MMDTLRRLWARVPKLTCKQRVLVGLLTCCIVGASAAVASGHLFQALTALDEAMSGISLPVLLVSIFVVGVPLVVLPRGLPRR